MELILFIGVGLIFLWNWIFDFIVFSFERFDWGTNRSFVWHGLSYSNSLLWLRSLLFLCLLLCCQLYIALNDVYARLLLKLRWFLHWFFRGLFFAFFFIIVNKLVYFWMNLIWVKKRRRDPNWINVKVLV